MLLSSQVTHAAGPTDVPLKGIVFYQDRTVPTNPVDPNCPISGMTIGTGTVSHLGRVAVVSTACIAPAGENFNILSSTITVTAANGDKLTGGYSGYFKPTSPGASTYELVNGRIVITGGNGRFANATGTGTMATTEDLQTGQGMTLISATFSYFR
jgi:hypothetical protein